MEIRGTEIIADKGKMVARKSGGSPFTRGGILPTETINDFYEDLPENFPSEDEPTYNEQVVEKIREKYSVDDELALLRQRDTKPTEFKEYFEYVESVKAKLKK